MCTQQLFRIEDRNTGSVVFESGKIEEEMLHQKYLNMAFKYKITRIPCGQCKECRLKYASDWAFRCIKEAKYHKNNLMLTLTYNDENLPKNVKIDPETGEIEFSPTLWKSEHQNFMKKLRKHFKEQKLKFFMCGEYGSGENYKDWKGTERVGTKRPHFHIIVFGLEVEDLKFHKWSKCEWSNEKNELFKSKTIDKIWGKGFVDINEVSYETCAYVARYVMKKQKGKKGKEFYEKENKMPEYTCCSRMPGIGYQYFKDNIEKFLNDEKHFVKTKNGIKEVRPGRYFDKLLESMYPDKWKEIKRNRENRSNEIMKNVLKMTDIAHSEYIENQDRKKEKKTKKLIRPLV